MNENSVELYIYDISKGLAKNIGHLFLGGKQIDGIWHTGVVVFGKEFFFGGEGISSCLPCGTILGSPDKKLIMGSTQIDLDAFLEYLNQLSQNEFKGECYHLFEHNCNTFSDVVCVFLTGKNIPSYITGLPSEVLNTPLGAMLKPFFDQMSPAIAATGTTHANSMINTCKENNDKIFKTFYDSSELHSAYSNCVFDDKNSKLMEEILEYLLISDDAENFWNIAPTHIDLLCDMIEGEENKFVGSIMLQMICLRPDVASLIFKFQKSKFYQLLMNYEIISDTIITDFVLCLCNITSSRSNLDFLSYDQINLFTNICQHCLLHSDSKINLLSCKLMSNMLINGKDKFDVFSLGVSLIELYNRNNLQLKEDIFMWSCFKMALELNNQLADVCRAMQVKIPTNSSNQLINDIEKQINFILA